MEEEKLSFIQALIKFLFEFQSLDLINYEYKFLVYIVSASILGFVLILIDYGTIRSELRKKSFFAIAYNPKKILLVIFVWTFSSGAISWLGLMLGVLNDQVQSAAIAGLSWIYILSNIIDKNSTPEDIQELTETE